MSITDNFQRRIVDMLDFTQNQEIFKMVMAAHDPEGTAELEEIHREFVEKYGHDGDECENPEDPDFKPQSGSSPSNVIPLKPKGP